MKGIGVSKGVCLAPAFILKEASITLNVPSMGSEKEKSMFEAARAAVLSRTEELIEKVKREIREEESAIFEAHCSILQDDEIIIPVKEEIMAGKSSVDAIESVMNKYINIFETMQNEYMAQRAADIRDIKKQLQRQIQGRTAPDLEELIKPVVLVSEDIPPSVTAQLDFTNIAGVVLQGGGRTSHTAILARTMEIPAVVAVGEILDQVKNGMEIALDGESGEVFLEPDKQIQHRFYEKIQKEKLHKKEQREKVNQPCVTCDGKRIELFGNIGNAADTKKAFLYGAEGIGLMRSEFLYLAGKNLPSEEMQYRAYKEVLEIMGDNPVIVRTLDIGGDKEVPALHMSSEQNPFLGNRAIRLCRRKKEIFKTQLRALLCASIHGNLRIMFPMISSVQEFRWAKETVRECQEELKKEGKQIREDILLGMMIEIPSAAVMAETFAEEADFFSIGTNDLTQYTLAVDRGNEDVAYLYNYFHPAVLKLIRLAITGAHKKGKFCGMCGEAAGDKKMLPLLIGMGLDEFSVSPGGIGDVKEWIKKLGIKECELVAQKAIQADSAEEVEIIMESFWKNK